MDQPQERKPAFITEQAHKALPKLAKLLTNEKGVNISYFEAVSLAIIEKTERMERREQRRKQRQQVAA
jgi:hypothetical protein